jgi:Fe-S-cluster-containing hydrogenase component 2
MTKKLTAATPPPEPRAGGLVLTDGPFIRPGPGPTGRNLQLLGLWLLPLGLTWFWRFPKNLDWSIPAVLAGALLGALVFAAAGRRGRAVADLDWLTAAVLGPLMFSPWPHPGMAFGLGLAAGGLAVRPGLASLLSAPGLIPLVLYLAAALTVEAGSRLAPNLLVWPLEVIWGRPAWPFIFAVAGAGLAWNLGGFRPWRFLWPWLAAGFLAAAAWLGFNVAWLPYFDLTRLTALLLPIALIWPAWARSGRELAVLGFLGLVFLWLPMKTGFFTLDRSLPAPALVLAAWGWLAFSRRRGKSVASERQIIKNSSARAGLMCRGQSPRTADWHGPASCRLAAAHDNGPRRCPYGCLGFGDCLAACPENAIERDGDGFPRPRTELCQGCGNCLSVCPKALWKLTEAGSRAFIPCVSRADLKTSAELCPVSCLGCGRCRKACPAGAIIGRNGASRVDQAACLAWGDSCGRACVSAWSRGLIQPGGA